ncbi:MAG: hypothetical protein R2710_27870 [Acidimicrobiales bacterium]
MWTGVGTLLGAVAVLGSLAILTVVLSPEQFGVYAGVVSAGGILLGFAVFGSGEAMLLGLRSADLTASVGEANSIARIWGEASAPRCWRASCASACSWPPPR